MFGRTMQAIQRSQTLFIAVFSVTFCGGITFQSAMHSRQMLVRDQVILAVDAVSMQKQVPAAQEVSPQSTIVFSPDTKESPSSAVDLVYRCAITTREGGVKCVRMRINSPTPYIDESSSIVRGAFDAKPVTPEVLPKHRVPTGIGLLAFLGWMFGAALLSLACVAIADLKNSGRE